MLKTLIKSKTLIKKLVFILFVLSSLFVMNSCSNKTTSTDELLAPSNISIILVDEGQVQISWQDNSDNEIKFIVDRKKGEFDWFNNFGEVEANIATFPDEIPTNSDTVFAYRVRAFDGENYSEYSDTVAWFSENSAPTDLEIEQIAQGSLQLQWEDNSIGEDGFIIERKVNEGQWSEFNMVSSNVTEYVDDTVNEEDNFYYRVCAYAGMSSSDYSKEILILTDIDGNFYQTVKIGDQWWMAENLKVTHYRDGDPIPNVTNGNTWAGFSSGAYCYYNNDPANGDTYGALYNWYAVDDSRGLAPEGWHVPTDDEIKELEMYLGMSQSQADDTGYRGTNEGSKLAGGYELWGNGSLRNDPEFDTSGFSFLPGGYRSYSIGYFNGMGYGGNFWSSIENNSNEAFNRRVNYNSAAVNRHDIYKQVGISVRCVRD